jgi:predicted RNA binding protein YcfA (HicA-like mRNA interferase family)
VRVPRDVHGRDFANHLIRRWDFQEVRQTGSNIILRTDAPSGLTITVPAHKPLRVGTFNNILDAIARHKRVSAEAILEKL